MGYLAFGLGIFGFAVHLMGIFFYASPLDMGIVSGTSAIALLGLISMVIRKMSQYP